MAALLRSSSDEGQAKGHKDFKNQNAPEWARFFVLPFNVGYPAHKNTSWSDVAGLAEAGPGVSDPGYNCASSGSDFFTQGRKEREGGQLYQKTGLNLFSGIFPGILILRLLTVLGIRFVVPDLTRFADYPLLFKGFTMFVAVMIFIWFMACLFVKPSKKDVSHSRPQASLNISAKENQPTQSTVASGNNPVTSTRQSGGFTGTNYGTINFGPQSDETLKQIKAILDANAEAARADQRALIVVKNVRLISFDPSKGMRAAITITNVGKTIARDLKCPGESLVTQRKKINPEEAENTPDYQNINITVGALSPNVDFDLVAGTNPLTADQLKAIQSGQTNIYLIGKIIYNEASGQKTHQTRYFWRFRPEEGVFEIQTTCNDVD